ncbi:MAG: hypothetical protein AB3N33_05815 [Puniceicoccaceae bacterium]
MVAVTTIGLLANGTHSIPHRDHPEPHGVRPVRQPLSKPAPVRIRKDRRER